MTIWELKPTDRNNSSWAMADFHDLVIVRATTEQEARELATAAFCTACEANQEVELSDNPWEIHSITRIEPCLDTHYDEDGPAEVIFPEHD